MYEVLKIHVKSVMIVSRCLYKVEEEESVGSTNSILGIGRGEVGKSVFVSWIGISPLAFL